MAIVTVYKIGTDSSGFYDHEGRPGLVGGSRSPSGRPTDTSEAAVARRAELAKRERSRVYMRNVRWSEIVLGQQPTLPSDMAATPDWRERLLKQRTDDIKGVFSNATEGQLKEHPMEFIHRAYEYEDKDTGMSSKVVEIIPMKVGSRGEPYAVKVGGRVEKDGSVIGTFSRVIYPNGEVHHDYFDISAMYRGEGFGSDFYSRSEMAYKKAGFKKITLFADLTVGGYAWARMGFDFDPDNRTSNEGVIDIFKAKWSTDNPDLPLPKCEHPWEIAVADNGKRWSQSPGGRELTYGHNYLMGNSWYGVKYLSTTSPTWQVGQIYYNAKAKKKRAGG